MRKVSPFSGRVELRVKGDSEFVTFFSPSITNLDFDIAGRHTRRLMKSFTQLIIVSKPGGHATSCYTIVQAPRNRSDRIF